MARDTLNKLSYEEHRDLAQELHRDRARMTQLFNMLAGLYGPQNWSAIAFAKVNEAMNRLVLELAAQAEADCPGSNAGNLYRSPEPPSLVAPS